MDLPFEEREIWALVSRLEQLKDNDVKGCWLVEHKTATDCHAPARRLNIVQRYEEMQDSFHNLSTDRK